MFKKLLSSPLVPVLLDIVQMYFKLLLIKLCRQSKYLNVYLRRSPNHKCMAAFLSTQQIFIKHLLFARPTLGAETQG